jgi:hypothetical protein
MFNDSFLNTVSHVRGEDSNPWAFAKTIVNLISFLTNCCFFQRTRLTLSGPPSPPATPLPWTTPGPLPTLSWTTPPSRPSSSICERLWVAPPVMSVAANVKSDEDSVWMSSPVMICSWKGHLGFPGTCTHRIALRKVHISTVPYRYQEKLFRHIWIRRNVHRPLLHFRLWPYLHKENLYNRALHKDAAEYKWGLN